MTKPNYKLITKTVAETILALLIVACISIAVCLPFILPMVLPVKYEISPSFLKINTGLSLLADMFCPNNVFYTGNIEKIDKNKWITNATIYSSNPSSSSKFKIVVTDKNYNKIKVVSNEKDNVALQNSYFYYDEIFTGPALDITENTKLERNSLVYVAFDTPMFADKFFESECYFDFLSTICFVPIDVNIAEHKPAIGVNVDYSDSVKKIIYGGYYYDNGITYQQTNPAGEEFGFSTAVFSNRFETSRVQNAYALHQLKNDRMLALGYLSVFNDTFSVFTKDKNKDFVNSFYKTDLFGNIDIIEYMTSLNKYASGKMFNPNNPKVLGMVLCNWWIDDVGNNIIKLDQIQTYENCRIVKILK